jgi:adenine-specific DNA-methyltransferase
MFLEYPNKKSINEILKNDDECFLEKSNNVQSKNKLIYGDNFKVLKHLIYNLNLKNSIDLVYIDPPFSTNSHFKIGIERTSTISSSQTDETAYSDKLIGSDFIEFLRERIILIRELLSDTGSIYLHIDYKIGHYVKVMMDEIFGTENFRNDITRIKCNPKNFKRKSYGNIKDLILFYTKTDDYIWNEPRVELTEESINRLFKKIDDKGRHYTTIPLHAPGETQNGSTGKAWRGKLPPKGRHWRSDPATFEELDKQGLIEWSSNGVPRKIIYADEQKTKGQKLQDIWEFKDPPYPTYPTQKNEKLLDLIVSTSSNENSVVMDCFAGSGTTILSANKLGRNWVAVDNSKHSIDAIKKHLHELEKDSNFFKQKTEYEFYNLIKNNITVASL